MFEMEGKKVKFVGWVYRKREVGKKVFIVFCDLSGIVQVVFLKDLNEEVYREVKKVGIELSVIIEGMVKVDFCVLIGVEVQGEKFQIIQNVDFFLIIKDVSDEFFFDVRYFYLCFLKVVVIMKVKGMFMQVVREWFFQDGWYEVFLLIFVIGVVEGGVMFFKFKYFDRYVYFSQLVQFYFEVVIFGFEKVWLFILSFRVEKSRMRRYFIEFWYFEFEVVWMDFWDIMKVEEEFVSYMVQRMFELRKKEIEFYCKDDIKIFKNVVLFFLRISYDEVIDIFQSKGVNIEWGEDMGVDEERVLIEEFESLFFVYGYLKYIKVFYMKEDLEDLRKVFVVDMFVLEGYGEIIGGFQCEDDYDKFVQRIFEEGMKFEDYEWYFDFRKYGSVLYSGFGFGFERFVVWVFKFDYVCWVMFFLRMLSRFYL